MYAYRRHTQASANMEPYKDAKLQPHTHPPWYLRYCYDRETTFLTNDDLRSPTQKEPVRRLNHVVVAHESSNYLEYVSKNLPEKKHQPTIYINNNPHHYPSVMYSAFAAARRPSYRWRYNMYIAWAHLRRDVPNLQSAGSTLRHSSRTPP